MLKNKALAAAPSAVPQYIEDVFSTYLYTGNSSTQTINNGIQLGDDVNVPPGTPLAGGYFAGVIFQGGLRYAVIVAPKATGETLSKKWKATNNAGPTATQTLNNGPAASSSMNSATYPAAQFCEGLSIGGYTDWYLPSRDELELCYRNLKPTTDPNNIDARSKSDYTYPEGNDVSGDTMGINRNSSPTGAAYTSGSPGQTAVTAFQSGGTEAFAADFYWSSSEYSANFAWFQGFIDGYQTVSNKTTNVNVRAVRRIPITDAALDPYRVTGKGGLVWIKGRSAATDHALYDTARGVTKDLVSNSAAETTQSTGLTAFNNNGFSISSLAKLNTSAATYASWTFRKAPKFFDVVTYTGNDVAGRQIAHNLGSVPGMIIVKAINAPSAWVVYHRSVGNTKFLYLNSTAGEQTAANLWNNTTPSSTAFTVSAESLVNASGTNYVAYLFAHNAGGFGEAGDQSVVSCGSYTGNGSATGPVVTLGWEPQYLMIKNASGTGNWQIIDNMRGMPVGSADATLQANLANAESAVEYVSPTSTGFQITSTSSEVNTNTSTYIYLAIRRGPMKKPTSGTSVFSPIASSSAAGTVLTTGFAVDTQWASFRPGDSNNTTFYDRLRGVNTITNQTTPYLISSSTAAEDTDTNRTSLWNNTGFSSPIYLGSGSKIFWNFRRAPGFFDVVCYTGTGVNRTVNHNLGVAPELMIVKPRSQTNTGWFVYNKSLGATKYLFLNYDFAEDTSSGLWNNTDPTASVFTLGSGTPNGSGYTCVAYLFATVPNVSKVGSYTGTGGTQTINAGLPTGARFVLIKRTDSTGNWWVWDTTRGMVAGTDPRLALNSTAAEVNNNWVYTIANGFQIVTTDATINASGGSYIYLAIA